MTTTDKDGITYNIINTENKKPPIYKGVMAMFPLALEAVSHISMKGSEKWGYTLAKQKDFRDSTARHLIKNELAQVAWNALAALERELELRELGLNIPIELPDLFSLIDKP